MIKYKANGISLTVTKVEIDKQTEKFVFFRSGDWGKEYKEAKLSEFYGYFDSFDEAKRWIADKYSKKEDMHLELARQAGEKAAKALRMVESND